MSLTTRFMWLLTVAIFTTGCSVTYQRATYPGAAVDNGKFEEFGTSTEAYTVVKKDFVRVALASGGFVAGEVLSISADKLVLKTATPDGKISREIGFDEIRLIEVKKKSSSPAATFVFMVATAVAVPLVIANQADKFMGGPLF